MLKMTPTTIFRNTFRFADIFDPKWFRSFPSFQIFLKQICYQIFPIAHDDAQDPSSVMVSFQSAVSSLRKALQKTMILPDIYKPVCNSEVLPRKHVYKSCKVRRSEITLDQVSRAVIFFGPRGKFCYVCNESLTFRHFKFVVVMVTVHMVFITSLKLSQFDSSTSETLLWQSSLSPFNSLKILLKQGQRLVPLGKKLDKDKPLLDGLRMMKTQNVTQEGDLGKFIGSENAIVKKQGQRLLTQVKFIIFFL